MLSKLAFNHVLIRSVTVAGCRPRFCSDTAAAAAPPSTAAAGSQGLVIDDIKIVNGLPHIQVPLPSRNEKCQFALKPISNTIGDFVKMLQEEDKGIDRAVIKTTDGIRIASTTSIQTLFEQQFDLYINDFRYRVVPPQLENLSKEELQKMSDVKNIVNSLYEALNIEEHQLGKEQSLVRELEVLQKELKPLEQQREEIIVHAEKRATYLTWAGLGMMSVQFGILARLTWWEYSWDIMEPVTYFVTYGTAMAAYAYFVLTRQEFLYPDAKERQHLLTFYKKAKKHRWDVDRYNQLKQGINSVESDLRRLRDPLQLRVPAGHVGALATSSPTSIFGIPNLKEVLSKMQQ